MLVYLYIIVYLCIVIEINKNMTYRIKEILDQQGLKQKDLAKRLGITEAEMTRMIQRDRLKDDTQERIATALGVRRCELFSDFADGTATIVCPNCGTVIKIKTED